VRWAHLFSTLPLGERDRVRGAFCLIILETLLFRISKEILSNTSQGDNRRCPLYAQVNGKKWGTR